MGTVDLIIPVGPEVMVLQSEQSAIINSLLIKFPLTNTTFGFDPISKFNKGLAKAVEQEPNTFLHRVVHVINAFGSSDHRPKLVVVWPLGSTWKAVNAAYELCSNRTNPGDYGPTELNHLARTAIAPLLDAYGGFSRYPNDLKIASAILETMIRAITRGTIGKGRPITIDSLDFSDLPIHNPDGLVSREGRQLGSIFTFESLPY